MKADLFPTRRALIPALLALLPTIASAVVISYPDFSSTAGLQLNGAAAPAVDSAGRNVLRLTTSSGSQGGSAFSQTQVILANQASFSTFFSFRFTIPQNGGADGMAFVVQNQANNVGGVGGGLGYAGIPTSVAVEFDTFDNGEINANHVGINLNGNTASTAANAVSLDPLGQLDQSDGIDRIWYSWVDYNGLTDLLEVRVASALANAAAPARPANPFISSVIDIPTILGDTDAFVGFTAATGAAFNNHDVLSWGFRGDFDPFPNPNPNVPESDVRVVAMLVIFGLFGCHFYMRRPQTRLVPVKRKKQ
jgi:hypothetical protein